MNGESYVENKEYPPTAEGLERFIHEHLEPLRLGIEALRTRPSPRRHKAHILGEGLQANRLEKLNRNESHTDRKSERTLPMLKPKDLYGAGHRTG